MCVCVCGELELKEPNPFVRQKEVQENQDKRYV